MEDVSIEMYIEFSCAIPKESFSFHQVPCVDLSSLKILVIFFLLHRTTFKKISFLENFAITLGKKTQSLESMLSGKQAGVKVTQLPSASH